MTLFKANSIVRILPVFLLLCMTAKMFAAPASRKADRAHARVAVKVLQQWYTRQNGLYRTTGWWNSANAITALANYSRMSHTKKYLPVFANTLHAAQTAHDGFPGFINDYYDDEGWWALAWIDVYDLTHRRQYLSMAESIFADMTTGWDDTCSGGIWWSKDRNYKNAIANELFLSVAAHLATRAAGGARRKSDQDWAQREWRWFSQTGMINADHLINDGLDEHCANNRKETWTYNQGVVLGGLAELERLVQDRSLLVQADAIAAATLTSPTLTDPQGILHDVCEPKCGADGTQFKCIFIRNLGILDAADPSPRYSDFLRGNARSIARGMKLAESVSKHSGESQGDSMSYDILKSLGLDHLDASSPDFVKTLERMQREAFQSLQKEEPRRDAGDHPETIVG